MSFDWDEYSKLSDEEKLEYVKTIEEAAFEAAKGKVYPPGSIAPEKARWHEGSQVIGYEKPDGTVHYYTEEEKAELAAKARCEAEADQADDDDKPA